MAFLKEIQCSVWLLLWGASFYGHIVQFKFVNHYISWMSTVINTNHLAISQAGFVLLQYPRSAVKANILNVRMHCLSSNPSMAYSCSMKWILPLLPIVITGLMLHMSFGATNCYPILIYHWLDRIVFFFCRNVSRLRVMPLHYRDDLFALPPLAGNTTLMLWILKTSLPFCRKSLSVAFSSKANVCLWLYLLNFVSTV